MSPTTQQAFGGRRAGMVTVRGQTMTELATRGKVGTQTGPGKFSSGPGIQISRVLTSLFITWCGGSILTPLPPLA